VTGGERPGWGAAVALAAAIFAALVALAGRTTLWDRDEPRFAQATVEMVASGDYLVPTFNGRLRPDKPVLIYWLMSLPMRWLGPSALAARLWSPLGIAVAALATFAIGRRLLGARAGLWAMAMLAATPLALLEGQAATTDAVLLAAITAAMACFAAALVPAAGAASDSSMLRVAQVGHAAGGEPTAGAALERSRWRGAGSRSSWPWWGLALALGLAQLAKGPVGLAVPGLAMAMTLWLVHRQQQGDAGRTRAGGGSATASPVSAPVSERPATPQPGAVPSAPADSEAALAATAAPVPANAKATPDAGVVGSLARGAPPVRRLAGLAAIAALAGVAIFCSWGVPADRATHGQLAARGLGEHVIGRALGAREGHGGGGGPLAGAAFYLLVVWCGFCPWVPWLPAAVSAALGGRLGGVRGRALLVGWVVPAFVLMTLAATRLPHYVLPIWPALALAAAGTLEAERRGELALRDRAWLRRGAWLLAPLVALGAAVAAGLAVLLLHGGPWSSTPVVGPMPTAAAPGPSALARALDGAPPAAAASLPAVFASGLALALVLTLAGAWALRDHLAGRYRRAAGVLLGGAAAAALVAGLAVAPAVERLKPAPRLAQAVRAATPAGVPAATFEYGEPSFTFYLGRWPVRELPSEAAVAAWAAEPGPRALVLPRSANERLRAQPWAAAFREIGAAAGWNVAKGKWLDLVALGRSERALAGPDAGRR
jgi:4-amino-4-deoxy-L-arabinose transferase-like glycosyltransferase